MLLRRRMPYGPYSRMTSSPTWTTPSSGPATILRGQPSKSKPRTLRLSLTLSRTSSPDYNLIKTQLQNSLRQSRRPVSHSMMLWLSFNITMRLLVQSKNMWPWTTNGGCTRNSKCQQVLTRSGWQANCAKTLGFLSKTAQIYSPVSEVRTIPSLTAQSTIT